MKYLKNENVLFMAMVVGIALILAPIFLDSMIIENCQKDLGPNSQCRFSDFREAYFFKGIIALFSDENQQHILRSMHMIVVSVSVAIGGTGFLLIVGSASFYFLNRTKNFIGKIKEAHKEEFQPQSSTQGTSAKSLVEMKKLLDEKIISEEEYKEYKKKYLARIA